MKNKFIPSFFILLFSSMSLAGIRVGNGGNVIVCKNTIMSLDLYEGEVQGQLHYQRENQFWKEILTEKLQRLALVKTPSKDLFLKWLADFDKEANFVEAELGKIDDSNHVVKPQNCNVVQAVNQQFAPLPGEKRYLISARIWNQAPDWEKAALVLHELAYRYLQQETSANARAFTALMFSVEVENKSAQELQNTMDQFGFR